MSWINERKRQKSVERKREKEGREGGGRDKRVGKKNGKQKDISVYNRGPRNKSMARKREMARTTIYPARQRFNLIFFFNHT